MSARDSAVNECRDRSFMPPDKITKDECSNSGAKFIKFFSSKFDFLMHRYGPVSLKMCRGHEPRMESVRKSTRFSDSPLSFVGAKISLAVSVLGCWIGGIFGFSGLVRLRCLNVNDIRDLVQRGSASIECCQNSWDLADIM